MGRTKEGLKRKLLLLLSDGWRVDRLYMTGKTFNLTVGRGEIEVAAKRADCLESAVNEVRDIINGF